MSDKDKVAKGFGALGTVLARDLSTVEDLPNYIAPFPGVFKLMITAIGEKTINEKKVIAVDYTFLGLKELNSKADDDDKKEIEKIQWGKDKMSETYYFDDPDKIETTLGALKKKFGPLGQQLFGTQNLLEILEKLPNATIEAQVGRRADDKDSTKYYPYLKAGTLVAAA